MREVTVPAKYDGRTLERFLTCTFSSMPFAALRKAFRTRDIKVNGRRETPDHTVHTGDVVSVFLSDAVLMGISEPVRVYEDDNIVIVDKPSGICVCDPPENELSLIDILPGNLLACHRLDRNTEGLVILAKTLASRDMIMDMIRGHQVIKKYRVQVIGRPPRERDTLRLWMTKDSRSGRVGVYDDPAPGRKEAITEYQTVGHVPGEPDIYELDIVLHTGRTHQIRACLAHIGCPVLGDTKYGNYDMNRKLGMTRQALRAYSLTLRGYGGASLTVDAPERVCKE